MYRSQLTGLRGWAFLQVFLSHASCLVASPFLVPGDSGVMLFFMLSGFLMGNLYLPTPFTVTNVRAYCSARVARVFPLYIFVVSLSFAACKANVAKCCQYAAPPCSIAKFLQAVTFYEIRTLPLWTIPVEVQFYAVLIALWYFCNAFPRSMPWLMFLYAAGCWGFWLYVLSGNLTNFNPALSAFLNFRSLSGTHPLFMFGAVAGFTMSRTQIGIPTYVLTSMSFVLCGMQLNYFLWPLRWAMDIQLHKPFLIAQYLDPVNMTMCAGILLCAALSSAPSSFLNNAYLQWLGEISYGAYIFHIPVIRTIDRLWPTEPPDILWWLGNESRQDAVDTALLLSSALSVTVSLAITVLIAHVSFHWVEKPCSRTIRNDWYKTPSNESGPSLL